MNLTKNIKIRILAIMMAFWLAFSVSYNDYQEVEALEWAIPVIGFDTAIKFLLGLLGVSLTSKALHDNVDWGQVRQNCIDYQISSGNDAVAVGEWWEDVIHGTLDQASDCWASFKEWVKTQINSSSSDIPIGDFTNPQVAVDSVLHYLGYNALSSGLSVDCYFYVFEIASNGEINIHCFGKPDTPNYSINSNHLVSSVSPLTRYYWASGNLESSDIHFSYNPYTFANNSFEFNNSRSKYVFVSPFAFTISNWNLAGNYEIFNGTGANPDVEMPFDSANDKIEDTSLTNENTTSDAIPGALPLPWDNVSDTAEGVADAIDDLQEAVAEGVLSLEDYWQRVQDLVGALAIDTTTDEVLPNEENPDTGENETLQDKVQENTSNGSFTLGGMEKVFPFCIPWDIYAFVTLLVANPVAPKINYPFYNPVTKQNLNIEIDFADWETVVVLFRYILDFLLIIGLLLLARSLSGAGGDD